MKTDQRLREAYITIHDAIHNPTIPLVVKNLPGGETLKISKIKGLRSVHYDGIQFIEQNPNKSSAHAKLAREGKRITWGVVPNGPWIYIDDEIAKRFKRQTQELLAQLGVAPKQ